MSMDAKRRGKLLDRCSLALWSKFLSFHAVSFGPDGFSTSLRRMVDIANEVKGNAPADPLLPANAIIESSYTVAIDTVSTANCTYNFI